MAILNEVYVGRLPEIQQMINLIHTIRKNKNNISFIRRLEKCIEELWGFKIISINIIASVINDIFTYDTGLSIDTNVGDYIIYTEKGYRFSKNSNMCAEIFINKRLLDDSSISDEELTSLLLHKIGHSFTNRSDMVNYIHQCQNEYELNAYISCIKQDLKSLSLSNLPGDINRFIKSHNAYRIQNIKLKKIIKSIPGIQYLKLNLDQLKIELQKNKNKNCKVPHYTSDDINNAKKKKNIIHYYT